MSLARYTDEEPTKPRLSIEDARTLRDLADAAKEQNVRSPELVAARAAVRIDVDDAATATVAAAEAMGQSPPAWAIQQMRAGRGGGSE
jgi:hypothetical protein